MKTSLAAVAVLLSLSPASAAPGDFAKLMTLADNVANIIVGAETCSLAVDTEAVQRFVEFRIPADDDQFSSMLQVATMSAKYQQEKWSPVEKAAHCTSLRRIAKSYKVLKD